VAFASIGDSVDWNVHCVPVTSIAPSTTKGEFVAAR
jgi:hypothetical protein